MNTYAILVIFSIYFLFSLFQNLFQNKSIVPITKISQFILLIYAITYLVIQQILPRNLFSIPSWILGLVLGHILYTVGFFITVGSDGIVKKQFLSFRKLLGFAFLSPIILGRTLGVAITEEIVYRCAVQTVLTHTLQNAFLSILIIAITFTLVHEHIFQNELRQNFEFLFFSIMLGLLYHFTNDLALVTAIHFIRNMESNYLEFLEKMQEVNNLDQCLDEIEKTLFNSGGAKECTSKN
ncbi:MAG TPA: CPBP family glutamic-type intramembrane protease [Candidatus Hydrogenedens sp.]|nr:CPBP family glutamic-type intramembrane protease [Candidatus Hydrogenedens sp.]